MTRLGSTDGGQDWKAMRIIPRLDIKGPNLVKGIHLEGLRILGSSAYYAERYYEQGADELLFMDAVASLYGRNSLTDIIEWTAQRIFIPLTVGGGLRSLEDMHAVLRAGADKVAVNTAALERPEIISEASQAFGSSTIVVSIDAQQLDDGRYYAYADNGRENTFRDAFEWAEQAAELGAGELLITSINQEGTGRGFDCALVRRIAERVSIPVIACGGAGSAPDIVEVVHAGAADAVSVASVLHFRLAKALVDAGADFGSHGDFPILAEKRDYDRVERLTIAEIKAALRDAGVACREGTPRALGAAQA